MLKIWAGIVGSVILAAPNASWANRLACLPGVDTHIYARRAFVVSGDKANRLHVDLERHSDQIGLSYGSVGSEDPATSDHPTYSSMTSILQSHSVATIIEILTSSRSPIAKVYIGNNCFEPPEDWRPYWAKFNALLKRLGYGPGQ